MSLAGLTGVLTCCVAHSTPCGNDLACCDVLAFYAICTRALIWPFSDGVFKASVYAAFRLVPLLLWQSSSCLRPRSSYFRRRFSIASVSFRLLSTDASSVISDSVCHTSLDVSCVVLDPLSLAPRDGSLLDFSSVRLASSDGTSERTVPTVVFVT
jgi:hypothetical protein